MIGTQNNPVYVADIAVSNSDGSESAVEDFESTRAWSAMQTRTQLQDDLQRSTDAAHGGGAGLKLTFRTGASTGLRGIYPADAGVPLPAIASSDFLRSNGIGVGGTTAVGLGDATAPVHVVAVTELFSSLDPADGPFLIFNRDAFLNWINRFTDTGTVSPSEGWFHLALGADRQAVITALAGPQFHFDSFIDAAAMLGQDARNPLIAASGSGILLVSFVALLALIAVAFILALISSIQRRRVEFAVIRTLGAYRRQILALLAFEYAVVGSLGIGTGLYLGRQISATMLSFLTVTETGHPVVPPFVLTTNWSLVFGGCALLLVVFLLGAAAAGRLFLRQQEAGLLRNTE
ncbi:MAG: ABC transporter permease [Dehalococcoidia bacterium]